MAAYQWPLRRTFCIIAERDMKWLKKTRVIHFHTDVAHGIYRTSPPCTGERSTLQIAVRKKPVFDQKSSSLFSFKEILALVSTTWRQLICAWSTIVALLSAIPSSLYRLLVKKDKCSSPLVIWLVCGKISTIPFRSALLRHFIRRIYNIKLTS